MKFHFCLRLWGLEISGPLSFYFGVIMVECKDCIYYYNEDGESECRRYPPIYRLKNPSATGYDKFWPVVDGIGSDMCGEGEESV